MKVYKMIPGHTAEVEEKQGETIKRITPLRMSEEGRRHSPTGFSWGYHGSGPAALASSILSDYFGAEVHPAVYQAFKRAVVAAYDMDKAWEISEEDLVKWLEANFEAELTDDPDGMLL